MSINEADNLEITTTAGEEYLIITHSAPECRAFANAVTGRQEGTKPGAHGGDLVERLERLAVLRDSGALSDEEYEQAKRTLLS